MNHEENIAVAVDHVYKHFRLPKQKNNSIKSIIVHPFSDKTYTKQVALDNINFSVKKGEFFGIVGRNGSGKSTLLKILAGIYQPSQGKVYTKGKLVPFIELGVGFNPELSGRENVYLNGALMGFKKSEIDKIYKDIVSFAELERFMDQKLKNYSSGMQVRLAFSLAIRAQTDILLIDEVLAVGDASFQKKCFEYFRQLKKNKKTVVFVSHDMHAVQEYCDRAILIEKNKLVMEGAPYDIGNAYLRMFQEEDSVKREKITQKNTDKRWGTGDYTIIEPKVDTFFSSKDEIINMSFGVKNTKNKKGLVIAGFTIKDAQNNPIFGTNSKILGKKINVGDVSRLSWQIPNVLNGGKYYIDIKIEQKDYEEVYDAWVDALTFVVERDDASPFHVTPIVKLQEAVW